MVVERVAVDGRLSGTVALSRRGGSAPGAGATRVKAVPVDSITGFLREQGAVHAVSDRPQLGAMQAQARARDAVGRHYLRMRGERCEPACPPFERE